MAKLTLSDVGNLAQLSAVSTINSNNADIEAAIENTLSRDGTIPNQMNADIDLNSYDLLNVGLLDAQDVTIDGEPVEGILTAAIAASNAATASAIAADNSADSAALSAASAAISAEIASSNAVVNFTTVALLLADTTMGYGAFTVPVVTGQIVEAQGFRYTVADSSALIFNRLTQTGGYHVVTAGGVKLICVDDEFNAKAFGLVDGPSDQTVLVQRILDIASTLEKKLTFSAQTNDILVGQLFLRPIRMILEKDCWFTSNATVLINSRRMFNFDGVGLWHITGYGAGVRMDKASFTGEHNHAWNVEEATVNGWNAEGTVILEGIEGRDTGGDGFYFKAPVVDFIIRDIVAVNNRRQGTSLVAWKSFKGFGGLMEGTTGTAPAAGVDIEPNGINRIMGPLVWHDLTTKNNDHAGILIDLVNYSEDGVNPVPLPIDIQFIGLRSEEDNQLNLQGSILVKRSGVDSDVPIGGKIIFDRPTIIDAPTAPICVQDKSLRGPLINVIEPHIVNGSMNGTSGNRALLSALSLISTMDSPVVDPGGVRMSYPKVAKLSASSFLGYIAFIHATGGAVGWTDVSVDLDTKDVVGTYTNTDENVLMIATVGSKDVQLRYRRAPRKAIGGSTITLTDGRFFGTWLYNAAAARTVNLPAATADTIGWEYMFEVGAAANLDIVSGASDIVYPIGNTAGRTIRSSAVGSKMILRCIAANRWQIYSLVGTWAGV